MKALRSTVDLDEHKHQTVDMLLDGATRVFLDTNVLAWSFRLNEDARHEFQHWLGALRHDERLAIPAWVVHEYNHHLSREDPAFFTPAKVLTKQLSTLLGELDRTSHLVFSDNASQTLGFANRDDLLRKTADAASLIETVARQAVSQAAESRALLVPFWEEVVASSGLTSDIQALALRASGEVQARAANRLAPGYQDAAKSENSVGDLVLWSEMLDDCRNRKCGAAVLLTNDRKADWVYSPVAVSLSNGKEISGKTAAVQNVKLPKPELVAEFERASGHSNVLILTLDFAIESLSSNALNSSSANDFRHLALAARIDLARTPTEAVIAWFLKNPGLLDEATAGVCHWKASPSEVDQDAFVKWVSDRTDLAKNEAVVWGDVFVELFL